MSRAPLYLVLCGVALTFLVPAPTRAQEYAGPPVDSTYDRAYQRFLHSLMSYRTFPAPAPGNGASAAVVPDDGGAVYPPSGYQGGYVGAGAAPPAGGYGSPPVSPNFARAYQHFLNSPYSYRTFSSLSPGYVTSGYTPYGYQWTFVDPTYTHQRITPHGFEWYATPPSSRTYTVSPPVFMPPYARPFGYYPPGP
jgi:hypothetical protein